MARKSSRREAKRRSLADRRQPQTQVKIQCLNQKTSLILVCGIFLFHSLGLASLFVSLTGLYNNQPIIDQDWGLHFHHLKSLEAFWRQDHILWGYNPFFMAGYPSNTIQDLSIKFFELAALGLSTVALAPVQWFKICSFLAMASIPWLAYYAARNFLLTDDSNPFTAAITALLGTIYWWNSLPREMFFYGMIGFPVASYLSVLGVSLFYRIAIDGPKFGLVHLGWLMFAAAVVPLHVQSIVTFLPAMIGLLIIQPHLLNGRFLLWISAAAAFSLLVNLVWLIPAIGHLGDDTSAKIADQLRLFVTADPFTFIKDYLGPEGYWTFREPYLEKGFRVALLVLGVLGIWHLIRSEKRYLGIMLASALTVLFLVTYLASQVPFMKAWQPLRFKVSLDLFFVIGASYSATEWLTARRTSLSWLVPALIGSALLMFVINVVQTESTGMLRLRSGLIPELSAIVDWVKRETPADARVLFEESGDESGFIYNRSYLSSLIPHSSGRQLIGGPINVYNDRHHFAEFHSGKMFKKDVQALSDDEIKNYFRLYNIGAVVAFHPASIQRLQSIAGLVTLDQRIGPVHLMKVNQPLTWFIQGTGKLKAGFNRLELSELNGKELILKYHWIEGLTVSPAGKIAPVKIADDPIPFIKIFDPPPALTLRAGS